MWEMPVGNTIKTISFDLWDTVLVDDSDEPKRAALGMQPKADERRRLVVDFLSRQGAVSPADVDAAYASTDRAFTDAWYGENVTWPVRQRLSILLDGIGHSLPEDEFSELVRLHEEMELEVVPDLVPGVGDAIRALSERYRLAVVSDAIFSPGRVLRRILEHHGLFGLFDAFAFSDEIGCSKPDPRMFEAVIRETGCTAVELVHIGDREEKDIAGPHEIGARAILVPIVKDRGGPDTKADAVCGDYRELPSIVGRLDG